MSHSINGWLLLNFIGNFINNMKLCAWQILTVAVLSIVVTAPFGAVAISLLGPKLLNKTAQTAVETCVDETVRMQRDVEQPGMELTTNHVSSLEQIDVEPACNETTHLKQTNNTMEMTSC